jgi:hypothetical protein
MMGRTRCPLRPAIMGTASTVNVDSSDARAAAVWPRASACHGGRRAGEDEKGVEEVLGPLAATQRVLGPLAAAQHLCKQAHTCRYTSKPSR